MSRFAEKMVGESNRLGNMVGELIELSRLQGAEPLPDLDAVDVDTVVAEAMSRYKRGRRQRRHRHHHGRPDADTACLVTSRCW